MHQKSTLTVTANHPVLVNGNRIAKQARKNKAARSHQMRARKLGREDFGLLSSLSLWRFDMINKILIFRQITTLCDAVFVEFTCLLYLNAVFKAL